MTFYIESLGCNKNQIDSEKMVSSLELSGWTMTDDPSEAELIIVNTCAFIKSAKDEAVKTIFELLPCKQNGEGKCKKFVIAGCFAQRYSQELKDEIPEADLIFGVGDVSKIAEAIKAEEKIVLPPYRDIQPERHVMNYPGFVYLKISEGCSNHCTYCAIPIIRGEHRSRPSNIINEELTSLMQHHPHEINLIAQDTAFYGADFADGQNIATLAELLSQQLEPNDWLRVLYMHPDHINRTLLEQLHNCANFVPYFDIPFQNGSDHILKLMGRKHNSAYYLDLIKDIREVFPNAVIRSTFITGFPGENDDDARQTLDFIRAAQLDWVGGFTYSPEDDTPAVNMPNQVSEPKKKRRLNQLLDLAESISHERMARFIGTTQNVLIEEKVADEDLYIGRIWAQAPEVDGLTVVSGDDLVPGQMYQCEIRELNNNDFYAVEK
ncbi:MAG: 30S ribosomal protein S12 methylthiotransferase RimO [Spirochaetales bacterium]|nr:30S ribosomal protein S12 methylthiotransferase RimO [Spirochaetales bacterium]